MIDLKINLEIDMPISYPNQIFYNHKNPWKDVLDYLERFIEHYCARFPATDRNKISWLRIMNETIRIFSKHNPNAPNFFDGWQLQFFYCDPYQPRNLTIVAVDCDMIGHDIVELSQMECK